MTSRVRALREAAGLSQAGLASAAGLSRQAIGAIEGGRHRPSVDAALAIARVLDTTVEGLFGAPPGGARPVFAGAAIEDGDGVLAARVGESVVFAPASRALAVEGWPRPNAVWDGASPRPLAGGDLDGLLLVGCDPALSLAAALLPAAGPRHVHVLAGSTVDALGALADGRVHGALVHDCADRLPAAPAGTLRVHVARWRVGIAGRERTLRSVEELCARRVRVVQREDGASTQKAFAAAAAAAGQTPPPGPRAGGHLEVAQRIRDGAAAGVTFEPAARRYGLAFAGLETHVAELWITERHREHPAVAPLLDVLRSRAFTDRLALVGAYDTRDSGSRGGAA